MYPRVDLRVKKPPVWRHGAVTLCRPEADQPRPTAAQNVSPRTALSGSSPFLLELSSSLVPSRLLRAGVEGGAARDVATTPYIHSGLGARVLVLANGNGTTAADGGFTLLAFAPTGAIESHLGFHCPAGSARTFNEVATGTEDGGYRFVAGTFSGKIDLGDGELSADGGSDIFVLELSIP